MMWAITSTTAMFTAHFESATTFEDISDRRLACNSKVKGSHVWKSSCVRINQQSQARLRFESRRQRRLNQQLYLEQPSMVCSTALHCSKGTTRHLIPCRKYEIGRSWHKHKSRTKSVPRVNWSDGATRATYLVIIFTPKEERQWCDLARTHLTIHCCCASLLLLPPGRRESHWQKKTFKGRQNASCSVCTMHTQRSLTDKSSCERPKIWFILPRQRRATQSQKKNSLHILRFYAYDSHSKITQRQEFVQEKCFTCSVRDVPWCFWHWCNFTQIDTFTWHFRLQKIG